MVKKTNQTLIEHWREAGPVEWAEGAYGWIGIDGQPVKLAPWQRAVLEAWWENRETTTTLGVSNVKKTGKTFTNAVLLAWRWLALPGDHFCVGNDLDQSAGRQFQQIAEMIQRNEYLRANCRVTNKEIEFLPTRSIITALAVDAAGNAGANHLTASHTETWGVIYEAGIRAYEELTPPPGHVYGLPALRICDSYAGWEGESRTWHGLVDRGLKGEQIDLLWPIYRASGLLLFHIEGEEARARCFRGTPEEAAAYYADQQHELRPNAFTRMHGNQLVSGEGSFVTPEEWAACYDPDLKPLAPKDDRYIVLGADASTTRDLTALVGCVFNPKSNCSEVVYVRTWRPQPNALRGGKPTIDLDGLKGEILRLHASKNVAAVHFDPYQLHSIAMDCRKAGVRMIELPQTGMRVEADQALYDAIIGRAVRHYGDPTLTEHIKNSVAVETPRGFRLAKEKTSLKIDAAVALSMAHYGSRKISPVRKVCRSYSGDGGGDDRGVITLPFRYVVGNLEEIAQPQKATQNDDNFDPNKAISRQG